MQYRHGGGWGEGRGCEVAESQMHYTLNLSTSLFNTLANQAGVVFPIFGFLANCTVRNILYKTGQTQREREK